MDGTDVVPQVIKAKGIALLKKWRDSMLVHNGQYLPRLDRMPSDVVDLHEPWQ